MTLQSHSWEYIQRKTWSKRTPAPKCSLNHYLQQPGHGSNLTVHRGMDKEDVVYIYKGILCVCESLSRV